MNRADLTTPQRRILEAIESAGRPIGIKDIDVASPSYITRMVRDFCAAGAIHIADWKRAAGNNNGFYARYLPGPGPDAECPKLDRDELLRRKRERQRAQVAAARACQREQDAPPALPATTPQIGFWGL